MPPSEVQEAARSTPLASPGRPAPGWIDYALLVGLALLWGGSFPLIKLSVETIPPITTTAARLLVAAVVIGGIAWWSGERWPKGRREWTAIAIAGFIGNAFPFALIAAGEETIDSGVAAILMAIMPLSTVLLAHIFTHDEGLTVAKIAGVLLGIAGLTVLVGVDRLSVLGATLLGEALVALAAVSYSINALVTRRFTGLPQTTTAAAVLALAFVMVLPLALVVEQPWTLAPSLTSAVSAFLLGIFQTGLGTLWLFEIVRRQGASFFSQINFLVPISGVAWSTVLLSERPEPNAYIALVLILAGIAISRRTTRR